MQNRTLRTFFNNCLGLRIFLKNVLFKNILEFKIFIFTDDGFFEKWSYKHFRTLKFNLINILSKLKFMDHVAFENLYF